MTRLDLPRIKRVRDRYGRFRYYYRMPGGKLLPLIGSPGDPAFHESYLRAAQALPAIQKNDKTIRPGTINALVVAYYKSEDWLHLSKDTQTRRRRIIERFRVATGDKPVALLEQHHLEDRLAAIPKLTARRHWLKAIRGLLQAAVPSMRRDNPASRIDRIKLPKSKGHHTWTDDEIEAYRSYWPLGTQQRLVFEFALETVSRRGEIVRIGPQHIKNGCIRIERTHGSADVEIPMSDELQSACDAMPKAHLTFIVTATGKPRSKFGLGNDFAKWATEAGLPARCRLHGLKKSAMRRMAEAELTTHEMMSMSGHKTLSEVQRYTAAASQKKLAQSGAAKLRRSANANLENTNPQVGKQNAK